MAFNIKLNRRDTEVDSTSSSVSEETTDTSTSGVIATHGWVRKVLSRIWNWTSSFRTDELQVTGRIDTNVINSNAITTSELAANRITLVDKLGKPMVLSVGEDGTLSIEYDLENVYVYSGVSGVTIKQFYYLPNLTVTQNFEDLSPEQILSRFVKFQTLQYAMFDEHKCGKLCTNDGNDEYIDKTLLFTCNGAKKIVGLTIRDENGLIVGNKIQLPSSKTIRMLTINMPCFKDSLGNTKKIELPDYVSIDKYADTPFIPSVFVTEQHPSIISSVPLSSSLFEDAVFSENESDDSEEETVASSVKEDEEPIYEEYSATNYHNIALMRSDFQANKKLFLWVETENA